MVHRTSHTYVSAQREILDALKAAGWDVSDRLETPHATSPDGKLRLWFTPQSVRATEGSNHRFGDARNFFGYGFDIRKHSGEQVVRIVDVLREK